MRHNLSPKWLFDQYVIEDLSCEEIGDVIGMTRQGMWKALKKCGIPIKPPMRDIFFENGERCAISQGYVWVHRPEHPRANSRYVKRAVLVLEEKLGRPLMDGEMSHHIDGDRMNDNPDNLEAVDRSEHMKIHKPRSKRLTLTMNH